MAGLKLRAGAGVLSRSRLQLAAPRIVVSPTVFSASATPLMVSAPPSPADPQRLAIDPAVAAEFLRSVQQPTVSPGVFAMPSVIAASGSLVRGLESETQRMMDNLRKSAIPSESKTPATLMAFSSIEVSSDTLLYIFGGLACGRCSARASRYET